MEKPSSVHSNKRTEFKTKPKRESDRESTVPSSSHRQKTSRTGRVPEARKERRQRDKEKRNQVKEDLEGELSLKSTVVDIDRVRDDQVQDENLGLLEAAEQEYGSKHRGLGVFEWLLMVLVMTLVLVFFPLSIWFCVKIVREHERAVVFRLGHLLRGRPKGPGLIFYLPLLDVCHKVDIRLKMMKIPLHVAVTNDLVRPELSAVCYYKIENMALCTTVLSDLTALLQTVVQAAIRDVLAQHAFSHVLQHRRKIGQLVQTAVDSVTCRWGISVERVDIDELTFPVGLQESLAAEAEAQRQQQAKVKAAEVETTAWEGIRASFRHLQPALVLPLPPDLLSLTSDQSSLPPPPPPAVEEAEANGTEGGRETDSPMM